MADFFERLLWELGKETLENIYTWKCLIFSKSLSFSLKDLVCADMYTGAKGPWEIYCVVYTSMHICR